MAEKVKKSEDEWKHILTSEQYHILREKGTEMPFTGKFLHNTKSGTYDCGACGTPLFSSSTKFDSGSGWPSFYDVISKGVVEFRSDNSLGMKRVEVVCSKCGGVILVMCLMMDQSLLGNVIVLIRCHLILLRIVEL